MNTPIWKSSDEAKTCAPRELSDDDIATKYFVHEHRLFSGQTKPNIGQIVVIKQHDDGYCSCKTVKINSKGPNGLSADSLTLFSGCLSADRPMEPEVAKLAQEIRNATK